MIRPAAGLLLFCLLAHSAEKKSNTVGWVFQCTGDWEDRTVLGQPVRLQCGGIRTEVWYPLARDTNLALVSRSNLAAAKDKRLAQPRLVVRFADTGERKLFDCSKAGECDPPPLPFAKLLPEGDSTRAWEPLSAFFSSPREAYQRVRVMISKEKDDESKRITADHAFEAVGQGIPIRDLIGSTAPAGEYLLELCPFDEKTGCPENGKPTLIRWYPGSVEKWPQPLAPGLYQIVLSQKVESEVARTAMKADTLRTSDRGLLLISPFSRAATDLEAVRAGENLFLRSWKADPSEGQLMFKALLVDLASKASAGPRSE